MRERDSRVYDVCVTSRDVRCQPGDKRAGESTGPYTPPLPTPPHSSKAGWNQTIWNLLQRTKMCILYSLDNTFLRLYGHLIVREQLFKNRSHELLDGTSMGEVSTLTFSLWAPKKYYQWWQALILLSSIFDEWPSAISNLSSASGKHNDANFT